MRPRNQVSRDRLYTVLARRSPISAAALADEVGVSVPVVVRLEGTNVAAARSFLDGARNQLPTMQPATDLNDAARRVCAAVGA